MSKSVEQKLFEAYRENRGVKLTAEDVESLIHDDAVAARISNQACIEAGIEEYGFDSIFSSQDKTKTWQQFVKAQR